MTEERPGSVVPMLVVNGLDHSTQLPALRSAAELDAAVASRFDLQGIERNVSLDNLLVNRGWAPVN